jgi:hypothetical protein
MAETGFSKKGLARRVVDLGSTRGYAGLKYNHSSVERWLRGEQPKPPTPGLLGDVFSAALGRRVTTSELGLKQDRRPADAALRMTATPADATRVVKALAENDLGGRRDLLGAGFDLPAYSSAALRWLLAPRTTLAPCHGSRGIGMAEVSEIRNAIKAFRVLDNRLGGGRIRPTVVDYLRCDITPLLGEARCTGNVRRHLLSAAAELAQLAGWQAYDLELHGMAQRYLVQALALARFAGDDGLGGEILAAMSAQAVYVVQPDQAIDMAQAAQAAGQRAGLAVLRTECLVMEAHGHALRQDSSACAQALRRAETTFTRTSGDLPEWLSYFDEAYFAAKIAHCFRALGHGEATEKYALRSLDMNPGFVRGRAFNIALLAIGFGLQGEVEQACARGREAVDLTGSLHSARAVRYIRTLLAELADHNTVAVAEFRSYAEQRLPALRSHASRR